MERRPKTLTFAPKLVFVLGLLCAVFFGRSGLAQLAPCKVSAQAGRLETMAACPSCCATMPCCLVSKGDAESSRPEPLGPTSNPHLDQAPMAVAYPLLSSFDFLARSPESRVPGGEKASPRLRTSAPRAAVSCIWLI